MGAAVERTNPQNYLEVDAEAMRVLGTRILVAWEESHDEFKIGKVRLVRPDTHKGQHYTGVVLKVGPLVSEEIQPGMRILFSQYSGFEKLFDRTHGRLALIDEAKQDQAFAIIPARMKIDSDQGEYNYDA